MVRSDGRRRRSARLWWEALPDDELLDVRLGRLGLRIEGSPLAPRVAQLEAELARAGLRFRPSVWLSTDWFSPDGVPGFAAPFYLTHPRLARIERRAMLEVEGGNRSWCMKLMRHETGHAIDTAYRLHRRKRWREHFGAASAQYAATYVPNPASREHVENLDNWYAQSHPVEDFAETFAVWLGSRGRWRLRYRGWRALRKLEYVDALMREIAGEPAPVRSRERTDSLPSLRLTLRQYYQRKKRHYGEHDFTLYDRGLKRLFAPAGAGASRSAASFLRERRAELRRRVAARTGQRPFVVDDVLAGLIRRSRELKLRLARGERETSEGAATLVTLHTARIERMRHREYFR